MELGAYADLERAAKVTRTEQRFPWRVRALLGILLAGALFMAVVLLIGAGNWNKSSTLLMVARVSPLRTWGVGALFIAGAAGWALWRVDVFACRLALVTCSGFMTAWTAAMAAAWIAGESQSPLGIGLCGIIAGWSIVLSGVPMTDPVREAAYGVVRSVELAAMSGPHGEGP